MLKGDLATTSLPALLRQLADGGSTGCVRVTGTGTGTGGEQASVFVRGGRVYAVAVPGRWPTLGARLVTSGALGPEALAEAHEAQRTELQGWRLGELLVHLGYVDQPVVEAFVQEQVRESLSELLRWDTGTWTFRVNERTREDVAPPVDVEDLLQEVDRRREAWESIADVVHGADGVPVLSAAGDSSEEMVVDADAWSMLCKVDGVRTVAGLARECGLTLYEAGHVVHTLVLAGLLEIEGPDGADVEPEPVESFVPSAMAARLASAFGGGPAVDDGHVPSQLKAPAEQSQLLDREPTRRLAQPGVDEVDGSISRVSQTLSSLLGPTTASDDVFDAPRRRAHPTPPGPEDPKKVERARLEALRRERDAEELAAAQAALEATRAAEQARLEALHDHGPVADVVDLQARRDDAAEAEAQAQRIAAEEEAERVAAEAERAAAEAEVERAAAEEEAERVAAQAERVAAQAEVERVAAEEEAERVAAQAEVERAAEEEAARLEAEAEAARRAEEEAARLEAEAEAARLAAEAEVERAAAEEEAARLAEEQRLAAEAEAARLAAEAEAERLAAEAEAARLAAEEEAARLAAVAEATWLAAEAERERLAAHAERARERQAEMDAAVVFAEETARLAEEAPHDAAAHAAVFAELSAAAAAPDPEPVPVAATVLTMEQDEQPDPVYVERDTDTAALLRELSSLGLDDDPPPPPQTRPVSSAPRPASVQQSKKRKGLFGRG